MTGVLGSKRVADSTAKLKIVVIGPCASGKSTLVHSLCDAGFDATVCAQEHSEIPTLWRHYEPDMVIALTLDLATLRNRRDEDWQDDLLATQMGRLAVGFAAASVVLDTSLLDSEQIMTQASDTIRQFLRDRDENDGGS